MRHVLIGLRAFGEAVFWGTAGGGAWGLVISLGQGTLALNLSLIAAVFGLFVGAVTGVVGAVTGGVMSAAGVGDRTCRIVAGVVSGICVAGTLWLFFGREVDEMLGTLLVGPREWLMYVVGPGLLAVAVGAWRGPAVLRSDVPQLRRRGDVGA
jgi:hypothetical protein